MVILKRTGKPQRLFPRRAVPGVLPAQLDRCFFGELGGFTCLPGSGDPQSSPVFVATLGELCAQNPQRGREEKRGCDWVPLEEGRAQWR